VGALLAVVAAVGLIFAIRVAAAQRAAEPVPVAPSRTGIVARSVPLAFASGTLGGVASTGVGGSAAMADPSDSAMVAPAGDTRFIVVHVVGEVGAPGVVRVPDGSRVVDAIRAAGGTLASADLERINLARTVSDGEQVHVPAPGEPILTGANGTGSGAATPAAAGPGGGAPVNLNSADLAQLDTLPGVGPVLAQRILDWRADHGRFTSVDELGEVSGIGDRLLAQLTPKVSV
jgi:competence protein ComEA